MLQQSCFLAGPASAQTVLAQSQARSNRDTAARRAAPPTAIAEGEAESIERVNKWTVGIVGGMIEGAPIRFATDIQIALDDGDDLRVLPIVSRGVKQNVLDLLYSEGRRRGRPLHGCFG